jgi:UDP-glucuronate 4-epimerase
VTGAAGFIGSHLAERLLADGGEVVGIDSFSDYHAESRTLSNLAPIQDDPGFRLIRGDLTELDLEHLLADCDVVFHLAGQPGVRASWGREFDTYVRDNVLATQRLLEAAKAADLRALVYGSSSSIYGNAESYPTSETATPAPLSAYGVTKLAGEHLCHLHHHGFGVPTVTIRSFTVFGRRQRPDMAVARFIDAALTGSPVLMYGDGRQSRDFAHVTDIVQGTIAAAGVGRRGGVYNLAGGSRATVLDIVDAVADALGRRIEVANRPANPGERLQTGEDTSAAKSELGFDPSVVFAEGIAVQAQVASASPGV